MTLHKQPQVIAEAFADFLWESLEPEFNAILIRRGIDFPWLIHDLRDAFIASVLNALSSPEP